MGLGVLIFFVSCQSPAKLFEKQKYDASIEKAIKKVKKGKKIDSQLRRVLEEAFLAGTSRDMERIEQLKSSSKVNNWELIYNLTEKIEARQDIIAPYLPIYDDQGIKANFSFVKTKSLKKIAAKNASKKYYDLAKYQLKKAKRGNKLPAREAYTLLYKIKKIDTSYLDANYL